MFQMEHNKAPGPDGFLVEFYQVFWNLIKDDLMALFTDFHKEELNLYSLNFGIITLIPKIQEATKIGRSMSSMSASKFLPKLARIG